MLIVLGFLIPIFIFISMAIFTKSSYNTVSYINTSIAIFIIGIIFILFISPISYKNYLDCRSFYDSTRHQYKNTITIYSDIAKINVKDKTLTDMKYNQYQNGITEFIKDFRDKIVSYNSTIIEKRKLKDSLFFSWIIVGPDEDMKLLKMNMKGE